MFLPPGRNSGLGIGNELPLTLLGWGREFPLVSMWVGTFVFCLCIPAAWLISSEPPDEELREGGGGDENLLSFLSILEILL